MTAPATMDAAAFFATPVPPASLADLTLEQANESAVPRDKFDRPLIEPADGVGPRKPYSRASSFGGKLEDKSALERWGKRQMLRGAAIKPEIVHRVPHDSKDSQPRTRGGEISRRDRDVLDRLVDEADEAVGSQDKAALGTDIHAATEFIDMGDSLEDKLADFAPAYRALLIDRANAYHQLVKEYGLAWDSIEQFGVQDDLEVAGTWDRRGRVPFWPEHRQIIGDVKTSGSMDFAGIGFAVQLAVYAHSAAYDHEDGSRTPHEDMDEARAVIIHVDREMGGPVELFYVDIATGWRYARLAREVILARREGKKAIEQIDERKALVMMCSTTAELESYRDVIMTWPKHMRDYANARHRALRGAA